MNDVNKLMKYVRKLGVYTQFGKAIGCLMYREEERLKAFNCAVALLLTQPGYRVEIEKNETVVIL